MKLTNITCKNATHNSSGKRNKLSDGGGLLLHLTETGKYWRFNYRFLGKQKTLSFGVYPRVSLSEAREKREEAKKMLEDGKDPAMQKKIKKLELFTKHENNFENLGREWHQQKLHTWRPEHAATILKRLEVNIFSQIGKRPIKDITPPELLAAVRKLEDEGKRDLAHRMMQHCGQIFRYAVATGRADLDLTQHLKGILQPAKTKHYPHLPESELPAFLRELDQYDSKYRGLRLTKLAFKMLILTFVRSSEIRGAKWEEIDFDKAIWKIPAERMKMKSPHIVPLARQTVALLKEIKTISGDNYGGLIFPSQNNPRNFMSENTFLRAIEVMGYKGKTVGHGFRSTASTILNENGFRSDLIETQLAHCERDTVRAAYNHATYLPERTKMMQWWGDFISNAAREPKRVSNVRHLVR